MKLTDYKFWYIKRDDDGFITEAAIRYYEGEMKDVEEQNELGESQTVNRYVREKRLKFNDLSHLKGNLGVREYNGKDCVVFTPESFGQIKTDDELRLFLNSELKKDLTRKPIKEQE